MMAERPISQSTERPANGIGALRLLFASLVIVSHSYEILDRGDQREPLHYVFHTLSFGALAVDAFFLISGYLITASFVSSAGIVDYFRKRILRIYPAFIISSLLCVFVVAPLGGAAIRALSAGDWGRLTYRLVMLKSPEVSDAFVGLDQSVLNGSAWTISYEFRCYMLTALLGLVGLYKRPRTFVALTLAVFVASIALAWREPNIAVPGWFEAMLGDPTQDARLLSAYMTGACFWLYRQSIPLKGRYAAVAGALLCGLMASPHFAESALILLGGYVLFWVSFKVRWKPLLTINARQDISYGTYLYAWPFGILLVWWWRTIPAPALIVLTTVGAMILGAVSWYAVERPALRWKPKGRPQGLKEGGAAGAGAPALRQQA
jgi:peptidoglycan/LPS O-acetylase OafA/YrhL